MGSCPSIVPQTIKIQTLSADVAWSVAADQSWLSVSGGGVCDGQVATNANCSMTVPGKQAGRVLVSTGDGQLRFVEVNIVGQALDKPAIFLPIILRNQ